MMPLEVQRRRRNDPGRSCSRVREAPVEGVFDSGGTALAATSCGERAPYFEGGVPSALGVSCLAVLQAVSAANPAPSESTFLRLGSFVFMPFRISREVGETEIAAKATIHELCVSNSLTEMNINRCRLVIAVSLGLAIIANADEYVRDLTKPKDASPLFLIRRAQQWGYMDVQGKTVIQPRFDDAGYFFNGLARVKLGEALGIHKRNRQNRDPPAI